MAGQFFLFAPDIIAAWDGEWGDWALNTTTNEIRIGIPGVSGGMSLSEGLVIPDGAVTEPKIADGAVVRSKIHDPLGLQAGDRWAAYGGGGANWKGHFASYSWAPTDVSGFDFELGFSVSSKVPTVLVCELVGRDTAVYGNIRIDPNGSIQVFRQTTAVVTAAVGTFTHDGSVHTVRGVMTSSDVELWVNGVLVGATSIVSAWSTSPVDSYIGATWLGGQRWAGTIHDVKIIDNKTPNNSIFLRMDERTGNFRNAYRTPGDPLYNASNTAAEYATRNGDIGAVLVPQLEPNARGLTTRDLASASVRPAAYGGGVAGEVGYFASLSWAPKDVSGFDFWLEVECGSGVVPTSVCRFLGRNIADYVHVRVELTGTIRLMVYNTTLVTAVNAFPFDGGIHKVRGDVTSSTAKLSLNGTPIASATHSVTLSSVPAVQYIGAYGTGVQRWPGEFFNVRFGDNNDDTNTAFFPMDEFEGPFINSHPGSTVGNATRNGLVLAANVLDEDGGSLPVLSKSVYLHSGANITAQNISGANLDLQLDTIRLNQTEGLATSSANMFTAPADGFVDVSVTIKLNANANPSDIANFHLYVNFVSIANLSFDIGVNDTISHTMHGALAITKGQVVTSALTSVDATTSGVVRQMLFDIKFYPDPQ